MNEILALLAVLFVLCFIGALFFDRPVTRWPIWRRYKRLYDHRHLIPDDEPVFLLRATDPCTPAAITAWLEEAYRLGVPIERRAQVTNHVETIIRYQLAHKDLLHVPGTSRTHQKGGTH